ncbi:preprotein translocase subunit SecE [Desulfocucumis palustris]|uniref:Protein translocase subunit SecE n=1 Tax=Desulfocucumis palustris TaxID=1898651 RepID=A0A2L2XGN3_9FIRM|nr:preprotein translocase subunit SecE [Desulfocucumis palustris]GBF33376.1 preprotein translocase subunit SecE [Desulfocucumis palustris]
MAVMNRKDNSGGKELEVKSKENQPKKILVKSDKKPVPVKKEKVNRIEQTRKYFRGVLNELKKVHWPNRREIIIYTSVVVVAVFVVGVIIWVFDSLLSRILQLIIR